MFLNTFLWWLLVLIASYTEVAAADQLAMIPAEDCLIGLDDSPRLPEKKFTIRHIYHHGTYDRPHTHQYWDAPIGYKDLLIGPSAVSTTLTAIERLADRRPAAIDSLLEYARVHGKPVSLATNAWTVDTLIGPNTTDKATVIAMAKMSYDAYVAEPSRHEWKPINDAYNHSLFNHSSSFGWTSDGLRGHVFLDETNSTMVIGLKGTSTLFDDGESMDNDKLNDNLFASCCCGQGGHYRWKVVCDCMTSAFTCNSTCLASSLEQKDRYYAAGRELFGNITARYPNITDIWLSGHSLGGVVAALVGLTYGTPVMTFEAFPDALAASRLGLPTPPGYHIGHESQDVRTHGGSSGTYHYGHTADPIFMGTCNKLFSLCTLAGYSFQSICHTGHMCVYDTVRDLGWRSSVSSHRIASVIPDVLEAYDDVPVCEEVRDCCDCSDWNFFNNTGRSTNLASFLPEKEPQSKALLD